MCSYIDPFSSRFLEIICALKLVEIASTQIHELLTAEGNTHVNSRIVGVNGEFRETLHRALANATFFGRDKDADVCTRIKRIYSRCHYIKTVVHLVLLCTINRDILSR